MAHDMGTCPPSEADAFENLIDVYLHMAKQGELPIRLFAFTPLANWCAFFPPAVCPPCSPSWPNSVQETGQCLQYGMEFQEAQLIDPIGHL